MRTIVSVLIIVGVILPSHSAIVSVQSLSIHILNHDFSSQTSITYDREFNQTYEATPYGLLETFPYPINMIGQSDLLYYNPINNSIHHYNLSNPDSFEMAFQYWYDVYQLPINGSYDELGLLTTGILFWDSGRPLNVSEGSTFVPSPFGLISYSADETEFPNLNATLFSEILLEQDDGFVVLEQTWQPILIGNTLISQLVPSNDTDGVTLWYNYNISSQHLQVMKLNSSSLSDLSSLDVIHDRVSDTTIIHAEGGLTILDWSNSTLVEKSIDLGENAWLLNYYNSTLTYENSRGIFQVSTGSESAVPVPIDKSLDYFHKTRVMATDRYYILYDLVYQQLVTDKTGLSVQLIVLPLALLTLIHLRPKLS